VLESAADETGKIGASSAYTRLFIYPGYRFKRIDGLITNFHLPRSSLYILVCAFAGKEAAESAYLRAVEKRYRFYSYGDCMLII
jgi:S-adenosylmethionine:tRNA ribosyltransferase-isomerase